MGTNDATTTGGAPPSLGLDLLAAAAAYAWRGSAHPERAGEGLACWAPVIQAGLLVTLLAGGLVFGFDGTFERLVGGGLGAIGVAALVIGLVGGLGLDAVGVPPRCATPDDGGPLAPYGVDSGLVPYHGLYVAQAPFTYAGAPIGVRMVVIPTPEGLTLWSPIEAAPLLVDAVRALGEVRWIVSPNAAHHLFLEGWARAFPDAEVVGVEAARAAAPGLRWVEPPATLGDVDVSYVPGGPAGDELVLLHRASGTLLVADLVLAIGYEPETGGGRAAWMLRLAGMAERPGPLLAWRLARRDAATIDAIRAVVEAPYARVVVAHGRPIEREAAEVMRAAFRGVLDP